ncbi:hypothetical protein [Alcaligenes sp. Marseille-Q7550]
MTYPDLIALCDGIFNHPQAYEAVLEQIPSARLRVQAVKMLGQVGGAAFEQLAHVVVSEPLGKIQSLSRDKFDAWMLGLHGEKLQAADNALHKLNDSPEKRQALAMRGLLGKSLGREMCARAQPGLTVMENRLARVKDAADDEARGSEASSILASLLQERDYDLSGWAPGEMVKHVWRLRQEWQDISDGVRDRALEIPPA